MLRFISISLAACFLLGCGTPSFLITPVVNRNDLVEQTVQDGKGWRPKKILIIPVEGMIANTRGGALLGAGENPVSLISQQLDQAKTDANVVAVVLRVNSPGGTVTASDTLFQMVSRFRKATGKPVVASAQEMAASGGYYVACAADCIVAQPTSVTGSVGVVFTSLDLQDSLGKLGVRTDVIKSGQLKDMGSPLKHMTAEERAVIQTMIDQYFQQFQQIVRERRALDDEGLAAFSDGRVLSGQQALKLRLVDSLGTLEDAVNIAKRLANQPNAKTVLYTRPYGYGGSIYATNQIPAPQANTTQLTLPGFSESLPPGFYYLWRP